MTALVLLKVSAPDINQFLFSSIAATLIVGVIAFFLLRIAQFVTVLRIGGPDNRFDAIPARVMAVVTGVGAHDRMVRRKYSGVLHLMIFYGFVLLGTSIFQVFAESLLPDYKPDPPLVNSVVALVQDTFAVLVLVGVGMALFNRLAIHPLRYKGSHEDDGIRILVGISLVMLTQLGVTASRINLNSTPAYGFDPSTNWRPVSQLVSAILGALGVNAGNADLVHHAFLLANIIVVLGFLAYLPTSKHQHIYLAIENIFFKNLKPIGALPTLDIENAEHYGSSRIEHFSWKHLLDTYTCTECGRCQDQCPAYLTDKPLSPKMLIMDMRDHLHERAPDLIRLSGLPQKDRADVAAQIDAEHPEHKPLIGGTILEETLWSCTMCGACMNECPVLIEHVPKIADMRRSLVLEESRLPKQAESALRSIESSGNPYSLSNQNRADWAAGLGVKTYAEHPDAEYLYFVGCAASFDEANQKVAAAIVKVLQSAGIDFAILGKEETCNGDPARRIGNEYLFQMQAEANITAFNNYKVKKVVTGCPHCFNTIKNEYPEFGFTAEVLHHTEMIQRLIDDGRLKLDPLMEESVLRGKTVTYHDPCYLGRWNSVYEPGRKVLEHIQGLEQIEMHRHGRQAFCCGAGGGRMWMEETLGKRINRERMQHAADVDADVVATACPFCLTMMTEGATSQGLPIDVADVAQMVATSLADDQRVPLAFPRHDEAAPKLETWPPQRTEPNANDVHPYDPVPRQALLHELKVGPEDLVPIAMPHVDDGPAASNGDSPAASNGRGPGGDGESARE